ncbi:MAG: hypothetical protein JWP89_3856 [Schlesneria sp.]|nr:hypothetical protein [Schlesneria sp.]
MQRLKHRGTEETESKRRSTQKVITVTAPVRLLCNLSVPLRFKLFALCNRRSFVIRALTSSVAIALHGLYPFAAPRLSVVDRRLG